jgi:predicted regulator of Ras-like GTPase activity (Roadblock/LC7/MglB family)
MNHVFQQMARRNADLEAVAAVDADGAVLAVESTDAALPDVFASFVASASTLNERAIGELGGGELRSYFVDGERGRLVVSRTGEQSFVAALFRHESPLGAAFEDVRWCAAELEREAR